MSMSKKTQEELDRWSKEVKRGAVTLAILALLSKRRAYGYEAVKLLDEKMSFLALEQGTVYPLLRRLEKRELLVSEWDYDDPTKPISVYINSPGGGIYSGMAIYDTMQSLQAPISTIAVGFTASFGTVLLTAGTAGKRYSLPNARILIHQPMGGFQGQASDIAIQAKEILRMKDTLNQILVNHTGKSMEQVQNDTDRDYFMSGLEAKNYGLIDHVIMNRDDLDKLEETES